MEVWNQGKAAAFMVLIEDAFRQVITYVNQIQITGLKATS